MSWITVKATREGLLGQRTASGYIIDPYVLFVALPSVNALHKFVQVRYMGRLTWAQVLDVGPWNEHDEAYVFNGARPRAETDPLTHLDGLPLKGPIQRTNGAGIDLGEAVRKALEITEDNVEVDWQWAS